MQETYGQFEGYRQKIEQQRKEIQKRITGLPQLIESLMICFYSHSERKLGPHLLIEGKVGKGKSATLETFARTISGASFSRIQFTPDLKPMDLVRIVEQCQDRSLEFHPGRPRLLFGYPEIKPAKVSAERGAVRRTWQV